MSDSHGHAAADHAHGDHPADEQHGVGRYIVVFLALCVLTGASFFTYSDAWPFKAQPQVGWAFMMAVSCTKAMLVMLFFMHLLTEANWKYVLTIPASMMSALLVLALVPDVGLRTRRYAEERWSGSAQQNDVALLREASAKLMARHGEEHPPVHGEPTPAEAPTPAGGH